MGGYVTVRSSLFRLLLTSTHSLVTFQTSLVYMHIYIYIYIEREREREREREADLTRTTLYGLLVGKIVVEMVTNKQL